MKKFHRFIAFFVVIPFLLLNFNLLADKPGQDNLNLAEKIKRAEFWMSNNFDESKNLIKEKNYEEARYKLQDALSFVRPGIDKHLEIQIYHELSMVNFYLNLNSKGEFYRDSAISLAQRHVTQNREDQDKYLMLLSNIYLENGEINLKLNLSFKTASDYFDFALAIKDTINPIDSVGIARAYRGRGRCKEILQIDNLSLTSAAASYRMAIQYLKPTQNASELVLAYYYLSRNENNQDHIRTAIEYIDSAWNLCDSYNLLYLKDYIVREKKALGDSDSSNDWHSQNSILQLKEFDDRVKEFELENEKKCLSSFNENVILLSFVSIIALLEAFLMVLSFYRKKSPTLAKKSKVKKVKTRAEEIQEEFKQGKWYKVLEKIEKDTSLNGEVIKLYARLNKIEKLFKDGVIPNDFYINQLNLIMDAIKDLYEKYQKLDN